MNPAPGSATLVLFLAAGLHLLAHFVSGWRTGVFRQLSGILAIGLAILAAMFGRGMAMPFLRPIGLPDSVNGLIAGVGLFLGVYILVSILTGLFFKPTADHESGVVRLGTGLLGALVGLAKGLFILWILFVGLRVIGTVAELRLALNDEPAPPGSTRGVDAGKKASPLLVALAEVKTSLDSGPVGAVMNILDPVPVSVSTTLPKLIRVLADEGSRARFVQAPGVQKLVNQPAFAAVLRDPQIVNAARTKDFRAIMQSRALEAALEDEELRATFKEVDIAEALDFALAGEAPEGMPEPGN